MIVCCVCVEMCRVRSADDRCALPTQLTWWCGQVCCVLVTTEVRMRAARASEQLASGNLHNLLCLACGQYQQHGGSGSLGACLAATEVSHQFLQLACIYQLRCMCSICIMKMACQLCTGAATHVSCNSNQIGPARSMPLTRLTYHCAHMLPRLLLPSLPRRALDDVVHAQQLLGGFCG